MVKCVCNVTQPYKSVNEIYCNNRAVHSTLSHTDNKHTRFPIHTHFPYTSIMYFLLIVNFLWISWWTETNMKLDELFYFILLFFICEQKPKNKKEIKINRNSHYCFWLRMCIFCDVCMCMFQGAFTLSISWFSFHCRLLFCRHYHIIYYEYKWHVCIWIIIIIRQQLVLSSRTWANGFQK